MELRSILDALSGALNVTYDDRMGSGNLTVGSLMLAAVLAVVFSWPYMNPLMSRQTANITSSPVREVHPESAGDEETFPVPLSAHWQATVVGVMEGGAAYAFERTDGRMFYGFFDEMPVQAPHGSVAVNGLWLGTTCAYRNTVFRGICVPEVRIFSLQELGR